MEKADEFSLDSNTETLDPHEVLVVRLLTMTQSNHNPLDSVCNKFKK
jgi:hypothetical protein